MAMTETRPEAETPTATPATNPSAGLPRPAGGLPGLLGTGRHRSIGRLWVGTSLVFLAVSGVLGAVLGAERLKPKTYNILNKDSFAQTLSLHGVAGVFLFAFGFLLFTHRLTRLSSWFTDALHWLHLDGLTRI